MEGASGGPQLQGLRLRLRLPVCLRRAPASLAGPDLAGPGVPALPRMVGVLRHRPRSWRDCVAWALGHWQLCFGYGITRLLRRHPPDEVGGGCGGGGEGGPEAAGTEGPPGPAASLSSGASGWNAFLVGTQTVSSALGV